MGNEFSQLARDIERGTLTTVDLAGKQIGDNRAKVLADAVSHNNTVTSVDLTRNKIGDVGIAALSETLSRNKSLAFLDLRENLITDEGLKRLAAVLEKNETLNLLNLSNNKFADIGTKAVANALKTNHVLTSLTLSYNHIMTQGAKAIAAVLQQSNNTLIVLNLAGNKIGDIGAAAIAAALEQNHSLKTVDLSRNKIAAAGAHAIGAALGKNKLLTSLILAENIIGDEGAKALAGGLDHNNTLTSLNISEMSFTDDGIGAIATSLKKNRSLISLNVTRNKFNYKSVMAVTAAVERSKLRLVNGGTETDTADGADEEIAAWAKQLGDVQNQNNAENLDTPDISSLIEEIEAGEKSEETASTHTNGEPFDEDRDKDMEEAILEAKIHELTKKLAATNLQSENDDAIIEMQQKLKDLLQQRADNVRSDKKEAAALFASHPNLYRHYRVINIRLEEIFLACKVAASEIVRTNKKGTFSSAATAIQILAKLASLLPFIGNSLQAIVGIVSGQLGAVDNTRQTNKVKAISRLGLLADLKRIAEATARLLTVRYQDQIKAVLTKEQEKEALAAENAASPVLGQIKSVATDGATKLLSLNESTMVDEIAAYAVTQILTALMDGAIDAYNTETSIEMQLINTLSFSTPSPLDSFKSAVVNAFGGNVVIAENGARWQLQDFYRKPGIKTNSGKFFRGGHTDAKLHGYRLGTEDEALKLGLKPEVLGARKLMNSVLMSGEGVTRSVSQREFITRAQSHADGLISRPKSDMAKSEEMPRPSKFHHDPVLARSSSEGVTRKASKSDADASLARSVSEGLARTASQNEGLTRTSSAKKKVGFADSVQIIDVIDEEVVGFRPIVKIPENEDARVKERKKQQMQKIGGAVGNGANEQIYPSLAGRSVEIKFDA